MRPEWLWDRNLTQKQIKKIIADPRHERFVEISALLLSRNNAVKEVFDEYLDKETFVRNWARIKRQMRKNTWNDPRITFWQAVYEKIAADFKEQGVALRPRRQEVTESRLIADVAKAMREARRASGLTQSELAAKVGISQQIISRAEQGRNDLRLSTLRKIAQGLGKTVILTIE